MNGAGLRRYLTQDEFYLCCCAAGIQSVFAFTPREQPPAPDDVIQAIFSLTKRGELIMENGAYQVEQELSQCFRCIRESVNVLSVYQGSQKDPCSLAYGCNPERFAALTPDRIGQGDVGVALYDSEEAWLSDLGLFKESSLGDLAEAILPDDRVCVSLLQYLRGEGQPENLIARFERRNLSGTTNRAFLVHQPLFDYFITAAPQQSKIHIYTPQRLCSTLHTWRLGEENEP